MKSIVGLVWVICVLFSCTGTKTDDTPGPDLGTTVEGVYKINNISGGAISNPSYNVLVNNRSKTSVNISEVINNTATDFSEVTLKDVGNSKIEFSQTNGGNSIAGFFLNGAMEYTLVTGNTSKVVKARR
jgi:hypothetical protein